MGGAATVPEAVNCPPTPSRFLHDACGSGHARPVADGEHPTPAFRPPSTRVRPGHSAAMPGISRPSSSRGTQRTSGGSRARCGGNTPARRGAARSSSSTARAPRRPGSGCGWSRVGCWTPSPGPAADRQPRRHAQRREVTDERVRRAEVARLQQRGAGGGRSLPRSADAGRAGRGRSRRCSRRIRLRSVLTCLSISSVACVRAAIWPSFLPQVPADRAGRRGSDRRRAERVRPLGPPVPELRAPGRGAFAIGVPISWKGEVDR